jgi:IS5 family transposase
MAKLDNTSETAIAITFLVMNISTWLRRVFCVFLCQKPKIIPIYGLMIIKSYSWATYRKQKV